MAVTTYTRTEIRTREVRRIEVVPFHYFIVSVDLGQSSDPTAICVLHHHRDPLPTWQMTQNTARLVEHRQDFVERFDVRHLERVPLGTSYPAVVDHVRRLLSRDPLREAELVIDDTGPGRPVGDMMSALNPIRVTITSSTLDQNEQVSWSPPRFHIGKTTLISQLDAALHSGALRFAASLTEAGVLQNELLDFRRKVGVAGRHSYEARVGRHDDLVLAVALGVWRANYRKPGYRSEPIPFL